MCAIGKLDNYLKYYNVSVHPDRVCITPSFEGLRKSRGVYNNEEEEGHTVIRPSVKKVVFNVDGKLSRITKSKINKAVSYLNYIAHDKIYVDRYTNKMLKYKLTFATLTLSSKQIHTDNEIKSKLINQFFVEARTKWNVRHYVWRGEKQNNGNLHIHILCDKFIPYQELNEVWNRIQNKLGYVDRYTDRMHNLTYQEYKSLFKGNKKFSEEKIRKAWIKGRLTGWRFPNSTDIHSLQFINDLTAYICKYMKKSEQTKDLEGRLWSASHSLSNLKGGRDIVSQDISGEINTIAQHKGVRRLSDSFYDIFFISADELENIGAFLLKGLLNEFIKDNVVKESSVRGSD